MIPIETFSISAALTNLENEFINAIPSIILFVITVLIGYVVAIIVSDIISRVLNNLSASYPGLKISTGLISGTVKILIILIALAIAFSLLNLGTANIYISYIVRYLPDLAGAILLLTLGVSLVNIFLDFVGRQMGQQDSFVNTILMVLRFGLYAVIITIAANLAIFYWIPTVSSYLFYDIIIGSIILLFSFTITGKAIDDISKSHPETSSVLGYARLILYAVFILIAVGVIIQPFGNVTAIIQTFAWGLAIAFAIIVIPLVYALAKKIVQ
ncbi:mechanosensitive ion channel family protein [Acidianus brierleyi]|uniref:Uncharacterized protein n=1 Tax=Acidianus brierleyi TaxID=41673 RepID=A0A2U9IH89_9CREN|nr:hypothetical protein [Acidianus brierleyi]AWR95335.1 hypothetical protein DFR85_12750 [Acidianus brierleyi]